MGVKQKEGTQDSGIVVAQLDEAKLVGYTFDSKLGFVGWRRAAWCSVA